MNMIKKLFFSAVALTIFCEKIYAGDGIPATQRAEFVELIKEILEKTLVRINSNYIIEHLDEASELFKKLESELQPVQKELVSLSETITKKEQELQTMANTLSKVAKEKKEQEIMQLRIQGKAKEENAQKYIYAAQNEILMRLNKKIKEVTDQLLEENHYLSISVDSIISGVKATDISDLVVERMNKNYAEEKKQSAKASTKNLADKNK